MEKKFSKIEGHFSQCYYIIKISVLGIILRSFYFVINTCCICQPKIRSTAHWKLGHYRPSLAPAALLPQVQLLFYYCFEVGSVVPQSFTEPVGIAFHINQISFVCKPINDCTCNGGISEDFVPSLKCKVWSNNGWFLGCP